eukprot:gene6682-9166_t
MPKNKLIKSNDLDELLAKSQRLVSSTSGHRDNIISNGTTNGHGINIAAFGGGLNRGVAELTEGSKQLSRQNFNENSKLEAYRLLSQKNFDLKRLREDVNSVVIKTVDDSELKLEGADIEGYLAHHHDMIILGAIDEANRGSEDDVAEMQRRWMMNEWMVARTHFMESLGHRSHKWEGMGAPSTSNFSSKYQNDQSLLNHSFSTIHHATPNKALSLYETPNGKKRFNTPFSKNDMSGNMSLAIPSLPKPMLSELVSKHAALVRSLSSISHQTMILANDFQSFPPCISLINSLTIPNQSNVTTGNASGSDGLSKADLIAYKSLLELFSCAVGENDSARVSNGTNENKGLFSCICFDQSDVNPSVMEEKRQILTQGAKRFLEMQVWELWSNIVDEAVYNKEITVPLMSSDKSSNSCHQRLKSYIAYQHQCGLIPVACNRWLCLDSGVINPKQSSLNNNNYNRNKEIVPLWPFIYHCLRMGDLESALSELKVIAANNDHGESSAITIINLFQKIIKYQNEINHNKSNNSFTNPSTLSINDNEIRLFGDAINKSRKLYYDEIQLNANSCDPYRAAVFNLLGLADRNGLLNVSLPGFTLEDFLWGSLWYIHIHRLLGELSSSAAGNSMIPELFRNSTKYRINGEIDLFEMIQEYGGVDYFDQDRSSPFKYATVLFCCQRFGDAIAHLWQANKVIPAIHFTILSLYYGLIMPHLPLTHNPPHVLVSSRSISLSINSDPTPAAIIQIYNNSSIFASYPEISVDYLLALDCSQKLGHIQGISPEVREAHKLKAHSSFLTALESFIVSLDRDQLVVIVGEPHTNSTFAANNISNQSQIQAHEFSSRTSGRLDDYMDSTQIDLLLARVAYNMLMQRKDSEAAIFLYQLAGRYVEVVDEMCNQLSYHLFPIDRQASSTGTTPNMTSRDYWYTFTDAFISKYLPNVNDNNLISHGNNSNNSNNNMIYNKLVESGNKDIIDTMQILFRLYDFVDACLEQRYEAALSVVDSLRLLPKHSQEIDMLTSIRPHLRKNMDDILIYTMECLKNIYLQLKNDHIAKGGSFPGTHISIMSIPPTARGRDSLLDNYKEYSQALISYANKIKKFNKSDTINIIIRMQATMV